MANRIISPHDKKVVHVKGINPAKKNRFDRNRTRQQDMPQCAGPCGRQIQAAAVQGYDGKWRCLPCNDLHGIEVLRESGDSAPNASEHKPGRPADPTPEAHERRRAAHAKRMLDRYGVTKRQREWT